MEPTTTDTTPSVNGNGRRGILHEAGTALPEAPPSPELETLGFNPETIAAELEEATASEALRWALDTFHPGLYIACSFQKTSSVTVHLATEINPEARFFYLDTDVLFPETYATRDVLQKRYGIRFHRYSSITLEQQAGLHGDALWNRTPTPAAGSARSSRWAKRWPTWTAGSPASVARIPRTVPRRRSSRGTSASGSGS